MQLCYSRSQIQAIYVTRIRYSSDHNSSDSSKNQNAIHIISAWASENNLVRGQLKVEDKFNELSARFSG